MATMSRIRRKMRQRTDVLLVASTDIATTFCSPEISAQVRCILKVGNGDLSRIAVVTPLCNCLSRLKSTGSNVAQWSAISHRPAASWNARASARDAHPLLSRYSLCEDHTPAFGHRGPEMALVAKSMAFLLFRGSRIPPLAWFL